jgi:hypothetical protein
MYRQLTRRALSCCSSCHSCSLDWRSVASVACMQPREVRSLAGQSKTKSPLSCRLSIDNERSPQSVPVMFDQTHTHVKSKVSPRTPSLRSHLFEVCVILWVCIADESSPGLVHAVLGGLDMTTQRLEAAGRCARLHRRSQQDEMHDGCILCLQE